MATVLARRGYIDPVEAARFLDTDGVLHDPFLFPQMQAVCDRIHTAISRGEKICIHGDYDVDGVTSTALMVNVLRELGAKVNYHLPNRFTEGYGIATATVEKIASHGAGLLITVDCGISARQQLERALELGLETIVIDHHRPVKEDLPPATIISALLCDYPFKDLAGVGLAFKVAQALLQKPANDDGPSQPGRSLLRHLDLVALGTIADVVPLVDENRSLVKRGLVQLARTGKPGLKALMKIGQVEPARINAGLVAFRMAPRINAAGRLEDPTSAIELLLTEDDIEAEELAGRLDAFNRERQRIENQMLAQARKMIGEWPEEWQEQNSYVLSSAGWHEGVIGIVASRLVETYYRPVIMIAEDEESGLGKGSGRSIRDFDLHGALTELSGVMLAFGGHHAACGLSIENTRIDEFRERFAEFAASRVSVEEQGSARYVDALACGRELTLDLARELSRLEPFGLGNPSVELLVTGAIIQNSRVTRDGQHLQCQLESGGARSKAIAFGQAYLEETLKKEPDWDVAFHLEQNEFNGSISPQLQLREVFPRNNGSAGHENGSATPESLCGARCDHDCPGRVTGNEFWSLLKENLSIPVAWSPSTCNSTGEGEIDIASSSLAGRLVDRRNFGGIASQVSRLLAGGENVLLLTADVARRRHFVFQDLHYANSPAGSVFLAGSRCGKRVLAERRQQPCGPDPNLALADFITITEFPELARGFEHLVFVDPPWNRRIFNAIASAGPEAFIHLFYCSDEVQFTGKVLEHEYDLRDPLTRVYRHFQVGKTYPLDDTTERLLLAGGKYLRQPVLIARCLRVLEELGLISIEDGTESPILAMLETERTELDRSPTYVELQAFYKECLQFLSKSLSAKII